MIKFHIKCLIFSYINFWELRVFSVTQYYMIYYHMDLLVYGCNFINLLASLLIHAWNNMGGNT